jgi:hypothetical protein
MTYIPPVKRKGVLYLPTHWQDKGKRSRPKLATYSKETNGLLELETVKAIYFHGSKIPELISPDNWNSDFATLQ